MSNTINTNAQETVNEINSLIQENQKSKKQQQERVALTNQIQGKQKTAKDVVLPSSGDGQDVAATKKTNAEKKPTLPAPNQAFAGLIGNDVNANGKKQPGQTLGLIAIIGEVMSLQAKSNSLAWKTFWKSGSESMQMEVKFAPIIGDAINSSYQAQSKATMDDAKMSKADGWVSLAGFGFAMGAGAIGEVMSSAEDGANALNEDLPKGADEEPPAEEDPANPGTDPANNAQLNENEEVDKETNKDNRGFRERLKSGAKKVKNVASDAQKKMGKMFGKGMYAAQGANMATQGINGAFIDSHYKSDMATKQAEQGQAQALDKESQQYAQFYGQAFSRSDTLAQGTQQNIDYAMNILKSDADTITSTTNAMFRG